MTSISIEEPVAAAIGAGLPVEEARGSMVVDIGGGTAGNRLISLNGVVLESVRTGGDRFDEAIVAFVRKEYGSLIGESTPERIRKHEIGTAYPGGEILEIDVRGRSLASRRAAPVHASTRGGPGSPPGPPLGDRQRGQERAGEASPPELASDIAERGLVAAPAAARCCTTSTACSTEESRSAGDHRRRPA